MTVDGPGRCQNGHSSAAAPEHQGGSSGVSPNSPPSTPAESVEQITDFGRDRWFTAPEAVAYGLADEVIGDPAGAPESGTPA